MIISLQEQASVHIADCRLKPQLDFDFWYVAVWYVFKNNQQINLSAIDNLRTWNHPYWQSKWALNHPTVAQLVFQVLLEILKYSGGYLKLRRNHEADEGYVTDKVARWRTMTETGQNDSTLHWWSYVRLWGRRNVMTGASTRRQHQNRDYAWTTASS